MTYEKMIEICPDAVLEKALKEIFPECAETPLINISSAAKAKVRRILVDALQEMTMRIFR
jgi:hypothetical protein